MENKTIYSKTARGFREVVNKTKSVPRELRRVLESVDGKSDFQALLKALDGHSEQALQEAISELIRDGYIRDPEEYRVPSVRPGAIPRPPSLVSRIEDEFDFTAMIDAPLMPVAAAKDPAEAQAKLKAKQDAEAKARQEAEVLAYRKAEEGRMKKEAEVQIRREAEAKAKKDAEAVAQRQAEQELARKKIEALIRQEAEAKAEQEAAALAQRKSEEDRLHREAEAKAAAEAAEVRRREIWAKSRLEAKILAKRKAEEVQAKKDAEAMVQQEAESLAQQEAEALANRMVEEDRAEKEAEAQRKAEEKRAKKEAAAQKKAQAKMQREAAAKEKAEAKAEREAQELANKKTDAEERNNGFVVAVRLQGRQNMRQPSAGWSASIASTLASMRNALAGHFRERKKGRKNSVRIAVFVILFALAVLHVIPFDERLSALEKTATAQFSQPVKAKTLHFWLLPTPHWRLQDVTIGDQGQIRIALVKARASIGALFSSQNTIASIDAESATLNAEGVAWLLAGKAQANNLGFSHIDVKDVQVVAPFGGLPNFDANATLGANGNWQKIELRTPSQKFNAELEATGNGTRVTLSAGAYTLPLSLDSMNLNKPDTLTLNNFSAVGMLANKEFVASDFSGEMNGGYVSGKARLSWHSGWALNGEAKAKFFDTAAMFPALSKGGLLSGSGTFAMQAADPGALMASARAEGNFLVEHGVLNGIDLGQALRGLGSGGRTPYATFDGAFAYNGGKTQLRHLRMIDGIMTTTGSADITADKMISSRFLVKLRSSFVNERSSVSVAGSLDAPQFGR